MIRRLAVLWRQICAGFDRLTLNPRVRHISRDCRGGAHDWCQAERDRTRADGHGACCRTDQNRCECCHPDGPIQPHPAGGRS